MQKWESRLNTKISVIANILITVVILTLMMMFSINKENIILVILTFIYMIATLYIIATSIMIFKGVITCMWPYIFVSILTNFIGGTILAFVKVYNETIVHGKMIAAEFAKIFGKK